jgi:hypothetical protein
MPTMMTFDRKILTLDDAVADFKDYVDVAVEERTEELARMVAKGFAGVDARFAEMNNKFTSRLNGIDGRLDGIDGRLEGMDKRFDGMDIRFDRLENLIIERTK